MTASIRLSLFLLASSLLAFTQQPKPAPQTPRQALIEMVKGGEQAIMKHLTVEIQQMIQDELKGPAGKGEAKATGIGFMGMFSGGLGLPVAGKDLKTFDTGPVFLKYKDHIQPQHLLEVRIDADDMRGDEDDLLLSIHMFEEGQEQDIPYMPTISVNMKRQEGTWRVNAVGGSVRAEIGSPKFFQSLFKMMEKDKTTARQVKTETPPEPAVTDVPTTLNLLASAEIAYAQQYPDVGFTCNLSDLVNDKDVYQGYMMLLDPQIASGTANGYHYSLSGCEGRPAEIFHLVAEPLAHGNGAKAFCINTNHVVRVADDGRGLTCLTSGHVQKEVPGAKSDADDQVELIHVK